MDNHLNPCEWPTVSDIGAVQVSNFDPKLKVRVELGRRVHLRLNDSAGLLSIALANGRKPDVAVLIVHKSGKVWRRVPALGAASAGHFSLLVPNDPSYGFALASADLTVNDHRGAAIADLTFVPFADPLTPEARALLKQRTHRDPEDPAVVIQVAGPKR